MPNKFTKWIKYSDLDVLEKHNWEFPGIYVIAKSATDISGTPFDYIKNIVYIGMTNTYGGLKARIMQFNYSLTMKHSQHGGADRFMAEYGRTDVAQWKKKLYISIMAFPVEDTHIDMELRTPEDLLVVGDILRQEYICYSSYKAKFKKLPVFNDKKAVPAKPSKKPVTVSTPKSTGRLVKPPVPIAKKKAAAKPAKPAKKPGKISRAKYTDKPVKLPVSITKKRVAAKPAKKRRRSSATKYRRIVSIPTYYYGR
ncbi:MAG: hypothetical protein FWB85_04960 [Chitinispirillia bacterium]|nr:hypothetical protein [Chitinispirillia bacterium]